MRLKALQNQLRKRPSVQSMVQSYLGIEPRESVAVEQSDDEIQSEFSNLAMMGLL